MAQASEPSVVDAGRLGLCFALPDQEMAPVARDGGTAERRKRDVCARTLGQTALARTLLKGFRKNEHLPVESLLVPFNGWPLPETRLSDHASFWDAGLPAVMITDTAFFRNPNYHASSDTPDTLDFGFMGELVTSLELALVELERSFRGAAVTGIDGSSARGFL